MSSNAKRSIIRVGSRKSELALIQTKHVISRLQKLNPDVLYEIHTMTTVGDRVLNKSLPKIGEKSLFTKDLEDALRTGGVDFVVHSLKDLPTALPTGMAIGAVLERDDPRDALVLREAYQGKTLATLPRGAIVGTSSLRRSAQLAKVHPHLTVCDIRGNLNTRLAKLDADNSKFSGIILAQAGLVRMGWDKRIDQVIEPTEILYAVGQGALAVECRSNDEYILHMLSQLCHIETQCKILAERSFLKTLGGGCSAPVAVCTGIKRKHDSGLCQLTIKGAVWSLDGQTEIRDEDGCSLQLNDTEQLDIENSNEKPSKMRKLETDVTDNANITETLQPDHLNNTTQKNPENATSSDSIDIMKFMSVHGDMFDKCPFSKETTMTKALSAAPEVGQGDAKPSNPCPSVSFPVGLDFMGDCPFVSTKQKIDQSAHSSLKCPITDKGLDLIQHTLQKAQEIDTEKCPFLVQQAKILDYNDNLKREIILPTLIDNSNELFCGMYRHKHVQHQLFEQCKQLGHRLAQNLISKGALNVMKCAQNEIRTNMQ